MVTLFFNFGDAIKNQYLVYETYINHMTNLMTKSELWDIWGGFILTSHTAVCCMRHTRRKTMSNTPTLVKTDFILKNQSCKITHFLVKEPELTFTLQSKQSSFLGNSTMHFPLCRVKKRRAVKASRYFNILINGKISYISI